MQEEQAREAQRGDVVRLRDVGDRSRGRTAWRFLKEAPYYGRQPCSGPRFTALAFLRRACRSGDLAEKIR